MIMTSSRLLKQVQCKNGRRFWLNWVNRIYRVGGIMSMNDNDDNASVLYSEISSLQSNVDFFLYKKKEKIRSSKIQMIKFLNYGYKTQTCRFQYYQISKNIHQCRTKFYFKTKLNFTTHMKFTGLRFMHFRKLNVVYIQLNPFTHIYILQHI